MSQQNQYKQKILNRLQKKTTQLAVNPRCSPSNKKTQGTPTDTSNSKIDQIRQFFESFEINTVTIAEQVHLPYKKPLRRCLLSELVELQYKAKISGCNNSNSNSRRRLVTQPVQYLYFPQRADHRIIHNSRQNNKENRPSYSSVRKIEQKIEVYSRYSSKTLKRYKTVKVL